MERSRTLARILFLAALAFYTALWTVPFCVGQVRTMPVRSYDDFGRFYYSNKSADAGLSLYAPSRATWLQLTPTAGLQFLNMNPPHFQTLLRPLTTMPPESAYLVWLLVNVLAALVSVVMIGRELQIGWAPSRVVVLGCLLVSAAPTLGWVRTGQLTGLLMPLATWVWIDFRRGRVVRAGVAAGCLIALKPFFLPIAMLWMIPSRRRGLLPMAAVLSAFVLLGAAVYGWPEYRAWIAAIRSSREWLWAFHNGSLSAPVAKAMYVATLEGGALPGPAAGEWAGRVAAVPVGIVSVLCAWRDRDPDRALLLAMLMSLLVSPLGWIYYGWLLLGPLLAASIRLRTIRGAVYVTAPCWMAPIFWIFPYGSALAAATVGSAYTWAHLGLWCGAARSSWRGEVR